MRSKILTNGPSDFLETSDQIFGYADFGLVGRQILIVPGFGNGDFLGNPPRSFLDIGRCGEIVDIRFG